MVDKGVVEIQILTMLLTSIYLFYLKYVVVSKGIILQEGLL